MVFTFSGEEEVPKKKWRKSRVKAGRDKEYDSDQDGYDRKSNRKLRKSHLQGKLVIDDGDEDFYQSRIR